MKAIIFCGLLGIAGCAFSAAGTVLFTQEKVMIKQGGREHPLSRGASFSAGDTITTGKGAAVNLKYTNGTLVNLGENSSYSILEYAPKADIKIKTKLNMGKVRVKTTQKTKEELTTPVAALAILGTDVTVLTTATQTNVKVTEGVVQSKGSTMKGGDSALINRDGLTYAPFPKEGNVVPPAGAGGSISGSGSVDTPAVVLDNTETLSLVTTASTGVTTAVTATTELATLSIICNL